MDHALISVANRAQIMNDALNLAKANILDYEVALDLTKYLEREEDYLPWESSFSSLNYISSMLSRSSGNRFFKVKQINIFVNMHLMKTCHRITETFEKDSHAFVS